MAKSKKQTDAPETSTAPVPTPRLYQHYQDKVVPALTEQFGYKNKYAVPKLQKIVISMGLGKAVTAGEKGRLEGAEKELMQIAGQKPVRVKAKKSVAQFKVREGQETHLMVTIRGARMYEFLDRLIQIAIPRVKDFRGLSPKGFDKGGNYSFGLQEQSIFPEIDSANIQHQQGMNITLVNSGSTPEEGRALMDQFSFPFRKPEAQANA